MLFVGSILVLIVTCSGQEHLTCLRTGDALRPSSSSSPPIQQGYPGKRGPIGLMGLPGSKGDVGDKGDSGLKGEPGVPDESLIDSLREQINGLRTEINNDRRDFYRGYKQLQDGWVALYNGYQYKKTGRATSWHASRRICQSWNADLVVYGVQDFGTRVLLYRALSINDEIWVGLTDEESEYYWKWVNGRLAVNSAVFWDSGQPDNAGNNQDCAYLRNVSIHGYLALNDDSCSSRHIAICEKPN